MSMIIREQPRQYTFQINQHVFQIVVNYRNEIGTHPIDCLIADLEDCMSELKAVPRDSSGMPDMRVKLDQIIPPHDDPQAP